MSLVHSYITTNVVTSVIIHIHEPCQQHGNLSFDKIFPAYIYDTIAWTGIVIGDGQSLLNVQVGCVFVVVVLFCFVFAVLTKLRVALSLCFSQLSPDHSSAHASRSLGSVAKVVFFFFFFFKCGCKT